MNMNRRTFILSAGLFPATSALANALTTSPNPGSAVSSGAVSLQSDLPVTEKAGYDLPFKINGWEPRPEPVLDDVQTMLVNSAIQPPADERMWININQSWRAAWR